MKVKKGWAADTEFALSRETVQIGRSRSCGIRLQAGAISRHHAQVEPRDEVEDVGGRAFCCPPRALLLLVQPPVDDPVGHPGLPAAAGHLEDPLPRPHVSLQGSSEFRDKAGWRQE